MPRQRGLVGSVAWGLAVAGCQFGSNSGATESLVQTTAPVGASTTLDAGPTTHNPNTGNPDTGNPDTGDPDTGNPDTGNPDTGPPTNSTGPSAETGSSTSITGQLATADWRAALGDPTVADAICDRVVHNAHVVHLKGPSGRKKKGLNRKT